MTTTLYVPGDRSDRFDKALAAGADEIILDLEDAVAEADKDAARAAVSAWLDGHADAPAWVRVNNRPDLIAADLAAVGDRGLGVVLPKAEAESCAPIGVAFVALIESARGILDLPAIAAHRHLCRLAIGEADLAADLGLHPSSGQHELWPYRAQVVAVSAANGLPKPTGPVFTDLADPDGLRTSSKVLWRQGFGGRSTIHPDQVADVRAVFAPGPEELARAATIVAAFDTAGGATTVDGEFVDEAVVRRARAVLEGER